MISCNIALLPILRLIESSAFQFNLYLFCRIWGQHKYALLRCGGAYWWRQHREFAASLMPHCISCISCDLQSGERCLHKAVLLLAKSWVFCIFRASLYATDGCTSSWKFTISLRLTSPSRLCKASSRTIEMHCWEKHDYFTILWPYLQWWHIFLVSVCVLLSEGFSS